MTFSITRLSNHFHRRHARTENISCVTSRTHERINTQSIEPDLTMGVPPTTVTLTFIRVKQGQPFMNIVAQLSRFATRTTPTKVLPPASEARIEKGHDVLHRFRDHASSSYCFYHRAYDLHRFHRGPPLNTYSPASPRPYSAMMESEEIKSLSARIHHPGLLLVQF